MNLNKQKGNMYQDVTHTGNVIKGRCSHDCEYCYMKRFGSQPDLRIDRNEFKIPTGGGKTIFVGSSTDMWAEDVKSTWITAVLQHCCDYPKNKYLFQSKNPKRFLEFKDRYPPDTILCTTMESNIFHIEYMGRAPSPEFRAEAMSRIDWCPKHVTVEPVMRFDPTNFYRLIRKCKPVQVNIGTDTRGILPPVQWNQIHALATALKFFGIKVVFKKSLLKLSGGIL